MLLRVTGWLTAEYRVGAQCRDPSVRMHCDDGSTRRVEAGDIVMVVESDKADMDVEAFESGFLAKILVPEGSSATVGP